jgi:hypothetical protein
MPHPYDAYSHPVRFDPDAILDRPHLARWIAAIATGRDRRAIANAVEIVRSHHPYVEQ